ncbi:hypothetical protein [Thiolapillus sp.]|nr:hypothetical protein [Thiolapillus sp.]
MASPLALCARRVSSAASRLLGTTSLRFALHGWQRLSKAESILGTGMSQNLSRGRRHACVLWFYGFMVLGF